MEIEHYPQGCPVCGEAFPYEQAQSVVRLDEIDQHKWLCENCGHHVFVSIKRHCIPQDHGDIDPMAALITRCLKLQRALESAESLAEVGNLIESMTDEETRNVLRLFAYAAGNRNG